MTLTYACEAAITEDQVTCDCATDELAVAVSDLIDAATDALYLLSGGTMSGRCLTTVRPCAEYYCYCGMWPCQCCDIRGITLPGYLPDVIEVVIDGAVVPPSEYAMVNATKLTRVDGTDWPGHKNPLLPDTEPDTFSVTYTSGHPWDAISQQAVVELVCEMAAGLTGAPTRLPQGTMAATADGVSVQINRLPGQAVLDAVGLTWLGRFLSLYGNSAMVTQVVSPEMNEGWVLNTVTFEPV